MSAMKFQISIERVEKTTQEIIVEADSSMEAYDNRQSIINLWNKVLGRAYTPIKSVKYHITKIEKEKEETNV